MNKVRWENKSRYGFILVFLLVIILLISLGFIYKNNEEQLRKEQSVLELQEVASYKTKQIENWKTDIYFDAKEFAESPFFKEAIGVWLKTGNNANFETLKRDFQIMVKNKLNHVNIFLTNVNGNELLSGSDSTHLAAEQKEIIQKVFYSGKEVFGDFYKNETNEKVFLDIAFPILDNKQKVQVVAVFQIEPDLNLFPLINDWPNRSNTEEFILFEKKGDSVLFINKLKQVSSPALSFCLPLSRTDNPAVKAVLYGPGTYEGIGYHKEEIIEVIQKIEDTPWFFAAKIDKDEMFAPVYARLKIISAAIAGLFLFATLLLSQIFVFRRRHFYKELLRTEQEKYALKSHYEFVVKYANDIILLLDEELNIVDANDRAIQTYQYSIGELRGMHIIDLIAPEYRTGAIERLKNINKNEGYVVEEVHQIRNGTLFETEISARVITIDGKNYQHLVIRDITERKRNVKALMESEEKFRNIFNFAPVGIYQSKRDGSFITINERLVSILEYSSVEELMAVNLSNVYFSEDEREGLISKYEPQGAVQNVEVRWKKKDGNPIWIWLSSHAIKDDSGQTLFFEGFVEDITLQKKAIEELEKSELKYRNFFEQDLSGDFLSTIDGRIIECNSAFARIFGYSSAEEIKRVNAGDLYVNSVDRKMFLEKLAKEKILNREEVDMRRRDGTTLTYIGNMIGIFDKAGNLTHIQGYMFDVTEQKLAEKELLKLSKAVDQSPANTIITNTKGIIEYVNPKFSEVTGYGSDEVIGKHFGFLQTGEMRNAEQSALWKNINSGKEWRGEFHTRKKNKELFWEQVTISPIVNHAGEITHFIKVSEDITEQKKAMLRIKEHERQLASMVGNLPGFVYRCLNDKEWTMLYLSGKFEEITGYSAADVINNKKLSFNSLIKKEYQSVIQNDWKESLQKRTLFEKEYEIVTAANELKWVLERGIGIRNENNDLLFLEGYIEDISARKKAEDVIIKAKADAESSQEYSELNAEISSELIDVSEQNIHSKIQKSLALLGNYSKVDRVYIFLFRENCQVMDNTNEWCAEGIRPEKENLQNLTVDVFPWWMSILKQFEHIYVPSVKDLPGEASSEKEILEAQDIQSVLVVPIFRKNELLGFMGFDSVRNARTWSIFQIKILQSVANAVASALHSVKNQSELIFAKKNAEESDQLKSAFLANMSHEIRTPMNGILGFMNLLNQPELSDSERSEFIRIINKSGERLMKTINDIIEISKIEVGDISLNLDEVNLAEVMQYYFDFFQLQTQEKGIALILEKQVEGDETIIQTDRQKLDSILMNLLKNAVKFTSKGNIKFGNYLENKQLCFYVTDTGVGIPKEKIDAIFDRFVQAELGITRGYEGSGIGLSIVKAYVDALGGTIDVKSEIGKGSTFHFSVPYKPVNLKTETLTIANTDETPISRYKILVAEDDSVNFLLIENMLSDEFDLIHAENGEEVIKLFEEISDVSLILMDIKMPGKYDGLEATRKIRKLNQQIPIIVQTAYAMRSDRDKAIDAGCSDYISKPFKKDDLVSLLKKYCVLN